MLIDTHAHLHHTRFADDLDATLARATERGVTAVIMPGSTLEDSRAAIALAERYADTPCALYVAVGIHPTEADSLTPATLAELRELAAHPRVVAIGEIGPAQIRHSSALPSKRSWRSPPSYRCRSSSTTGMPTPTSSPS